MTFAPKFAVGDLVEVVEAKIKGTVTRIDDDSDLYYVRFRNHSGCYTRVQLKKTGLGNFRVWLNADILAQDENEAKEFAQQIADDLIEQSEGATLDDWEPRIIDAWPTQVH